MSSLHLKNLTWLLLSIIIIVIDQVTKLYFNQKLQLGQSIELLPVLNWTLAYNYGAAFSFLHDAGGWQRWFFAGIAVVVSLGLTIWLVKLEKNAKFLAFAIALLLGGAIGNLYDRMTYGYVIDFIHVFYQTWHFPIFNVADCAITVGAIMLIIDSLFFEQKRQVSK
ncbi:MAG TPA: signal peptidase II [Agitococcus sp.]|nr:signal peptidase II [Agitococcus sp.]HNH44437.1 signal peptidase II [Agitococcus sp.]HNJ87245.1 signal peptidase II [Agitococcus sp.]HNL37298.1 signal peptidase II [Agitococcus sp.]HNN30063.1 signal peptidase II [Agitococcus sp.]